MMKRLFSVLLTLAMVALALSSCPSPGGGDTGDTPSADIAEVDKTFSDGDLSPDYDESSATRIVFSEGSVSVDGSGVAVSGTSVTISKKGTYIISGSCSDGSLSVDCGTGNKVQIVLSGLDLTSLSGPAINIKSGKKITITLASGTKNEISDSSDYSSLSSGDNADAAIFSKSDLVINGSGELTVNGRYAHGIVSKDSLDITGGVIRVTSVKSGICGKDCVKITAADITVDAGTDCIKAGASSQSADSGSSASASEAIGYIYIKDGAFALEAYKDALQATGVISIDGGSFDIVTEATDSNVSAKAIKSGEGISISGGSFDIDSRDDALHSHGDISITGGGFTIATGDDGVHSDATLVISGGDIIITASYEGLEGSEVLISGGQIDITSSDDGINAVGGDDNNAGVGGRPGNDFFIGAGGNGLIKISGGYIIVHAEGDGVDSNGRLEVRGGVVLIDGPSVGGNGSLDYDISASITGGVVVALGARDMAQNFSSAEQGSVLVSFNGYGSSGSVVSIVDGSGKAILTFTSTKSFNCALFSAPELTSSETYSIYMNGSVEGLDANGFAHNATVEGGDLLGTVTLSANIYGSGNGMMGGGMGGPGGMGGHGGMGGPGGGRH